jgi:isochorismate hydrolase
MSGIPEIEAYPMPMLSQLPVNVANWKIDPQRAVLLVHDMQRFFVRRIPSENPRSLLLRNSALIRQYCINLGMPIAYTTQPGGMTDSERGLLKDFWGTGMKVDPIDREIVEELLPCPQDWLFTKWRYSAFHQSDLLQRMRETGHDQLIICGVYAHIGVLITAVEAFSNDIKVFLVADAIADFSQAHHLMALNYAARCCAVTLLTNKVIQ